MEELRVIYTLPQKVKISAIVAGGFLCVLSLGIAISRALANQFGFLFYVGVAGAIIGILLLLTVTIWQSDLVIEIDNEDFKIKLPKQRFNGSISWETVTHIGIGLSYLALTGTEGNYKIDLGNLKYNDLKSIKNKLIEVCEAKNIPYGNV